MSSIRMANFILIVTAAANSLSVVMAGNDECDHCRSMVDEIGIAAAAAATTDPELFVRSAVENRYSSGSDNELEEGKVRIRHFHPTDSVALSIPHYTLVDSLEFGFPRYNLAGSSDIGIPHYNVVDSLEKEEEERQTGLIKRMIPILQSMLTTSNNPEVRQLANRNLADWTKFLGQKRAASIKSGGRGRGAKKRRKQKGGSKKRKS
jgi:hypothetical protein